MAGCSTKHTILKELGSKNLDTIRKKSIFVVGTGGLGSLLLQYLSRLNISKITIVDFDKIDSSNLERQILYTKKDLGKYKVDIAKEVLCNFTNIIKYRKSILDIERNKKMLKDFIDSNIVVDCVDDNCTKKFIFDICKKYKKTLIVGSCASTKAYVYAVKSSSDYKKFESIYNKKYLDDSDSGVYSLAVAMCSTIMSTLCVRILLEYNDCFCKLYNLNAWDVYLDSYNM